MSEKYKFTTWDFRTGFIEKDELDKFRLEVEKDRKSKTPYSTTWLLEHIIFRKSKRSQFSISDSVIDWELVRNK